MVQTPTPPPATDDKPAAAVCTAPIVPQQVPDKQKAEPDDDDDVSELSSLGQCPLCKEMKMEQKLLKPCQHHFCVECLTDKAVQAGGESLPCPQPGCDVVSEIMSFIPFYICMVHQ